MGKGKLYRGAVVPYLLGALLVVSGCDGPSAPAPVASVEIVASTEVMEEGETLQLQAVLRAWDGSVLEGREVQWRSSDERVATVSPTGLVTALAPGAVTITATAEEVSEQTTFTVGRRKLYRLEHLGGLPGMTHAAAVAVNDAGQVVVIGWNQGAADQRDGEAVYLWESGRLTPVVLVSGPEQAFRARPVGISNAGLIAGSVHVGETRFVFRWQQGRTELQVIPLEAFFEVVANGMNQRGDVVGGGPGKGCRNPWCAGMAFLSRAGGETVLIPNESPEMAGLRQQLYGRAHWLDLRDINDAGQITGTIFQSMKSPPDAHRAFRLEGTSLTELTGFDVGGSAGNTIDSRGDVAGYLAAPFASRVSPVLWTVGGTQLLEPYLGGNVAAVTRRNEQGVAIGYSSIDLRPEFIPVLFQGQETIRLDELYETGDWLLTVAADVNERGQIAGRARHRVTGAIEAVLLTPLGS